MPAGYTSSMGGTPAPYGTSPADLIYPQSLADQQLANIQGKYGVKQSQIGANAQLGSAQAAAEANRFGATQQRGAGQDIINYKNQRFGQLFPLLQGAMGGVSGGAVGNYGYGTAQAAATRAGGPTPAPSGSGGGSTSSAASVEGSVPGLGELAPAISNDQLQQNINLNNAQNWAQAGGAQRRGVNQLAGGGLGANSPLARALGAQVFGGALQANTAGATGARNEAAKLNADQAATAYQTKGGALASEYGARQAAGASQYGSLLANQASKYGSQLDYQAALAQVAAQKQNAILSALASFSS